MDDTLPDRKLWRETFPRLVTMLEDGLDFLGLGVAVFDSDLELVACNHLFRKIRRYPADLCRPGTGMAELLDHDRESGLDPVSDGASSRDAWLKFATNGRRHSERVTVGDGRVLAVAIMPAGGAGFLFTICDLTGQTSAEDELRANREWLNLVMEAASEGIYDWEIPSDRLKVSYQLTAMLGMVPGALTSQDWNDRVHPDDQESYRSALADHFRGKTRYLRTEYRLRDETGRYFWVSDSGNCVRGSDGRAVRLVGAVADISARRAAEEQLAEGRERYSLAMEAINEGVYDWDIEGGTVHYSEGVRTILGFEPAELRTPEDWFRRIHPDDREEWNRALIAHFKNDAPRFECEFRYRSQDDRWRWARQHGIARRNAEGRALRMIGATGDITELKEAELKLLESEERYALATEASTEGIYDWNVAEDLLAVSQRLNTIMKLPRETLSSREWNNRVHESDRNRYGEAMRAHFKGSTAHLSCEYRVRDGTGRFIWIADNATSVRDHAGRVTRLVGAIANITARKAAEDALREARQRAEDARLLAMEKAEMLESLSLKLSKYLSPQVYSSIFSGRQSVAVEAKRKKLTIFFSDIVGFTSIADMLESEELTELLNDYLTEMSHLALEHGATIDKFIGDAILAFFGDPETKGPAEDALACVRMAIAMQKRMRELQTGWRNRGLDRSFELRIGITTGYCTVGNFGSDDRMDYTVVGNEVNRAARLQNFAETGGILISGETYALVKNEIVAEDKGHIELKGIPHPVHAYSVEGIHDGLGDGNEVLEFESQGLRLVIRPSELADRRDKAIETLQLALRKLRQSP